MVRAQLDVWVAMRAFREVAYAIRDALVAVNLWQQMALDDHVVMIWPTKFGWQYRAIVKDGASYSGMSETLADAVFESRKRTYGE